MAPDIIHDSIVKLLAGEVNVPHDSSRAWSTVLNTIRNVAWNYYRSEQVRHAAPPIASDATPFGVDDAADMTWKMCRGIELRYELGRAMECLTVCEREVVKLRYLSGYSTAKAAELRESSPHTVKKLASRALAKLRVELKGQFGPE